MSLNASGGALRAAALALALAVSAGAGAHPARAGANFPDVPVWAMAGAWQDSTAFDPSRCAGSFQLPKDTLRNQSRTITVRFLRDRTTELRPDFGGYRLYRMTNAPDSGSAELLRRFSLNVGSELTWDASRVARASTISILPGLGDGTFGPRQEVSSGIAPLALAAADLNRDGRLDIVVANQQSGNVSEFVGLDTGGLGLFKTFDARGTPSAIAAGDLDADTVSDAIVVSQDQNLVTLLLSGPIPDTSYATGLQPSAVAVADLNRDGRPDVVVANAGSNNVSVYLALSKGRLGARTDIPVGPNPSALALADLNGDGTPDLVVTNRGDNTLYVFLGTGAGAFGAPAILPTGNAPSAVAVQDVNADGIPDLAVTNAADATVSIFKGMGGGVFAPRTDFGSGAGPAAVAIGDLNGDGKPDLGVANAAAASVSVLLGDGLGGFGAKTDFPTGVNPTSLAIGELTGDTHPDLVVANRSYSLPYICNATVANDSILTYMDPDSNGQYVKVCRRILPDGRCGSPGDSIFVLRAPPGPHDGFLTWYSVTIERRNTTDPDYEDLFVPDTTNNFARCSTPGDPKTCPNLNNKLRNLAGPLEPTAGPTANLEKVLVVPNPYRGHEVWDQPGGGEVHFINLPAVSKIRIYTAAGDLVRELQHSDKIRDFERWDLKNASGRDVASGIYMFRVESGSFHFQNRFIVIR